MTKLAKRCAIALAALASLVTASNAGPLVLLEAESGRVLYADGLDDQWFPASLTKIMTAYLAFDALKAGRLKLDDTVVVSEKAALQAPSKLGLPVGSEISVDLAIRALVVKSANDSAIMLAEKIAGSEEDFVRLMNDTARRLGMTRTTFANANGLPVPGQVTTARDLARLSRAVLKDFPERNDLWAQPEVRIGKLKLRSHNGLLRSFDGADGIKTGFICDSGFNVVASATRENKRLIAIVLGEPSGRDRNLVAAGLLDHGFETAEWKAALGAKTLDNLPIDPNAQPAVSVRTSVVAWDCSGRRPVRKIARKKQQPVAARKAPAAHGPRTSQAPANGSASRTAAAQKGAAPSPKAAQPANAPSKQ